MYSWQETKGFHMESPTKRGTLVPAHSRRGSHQMGMRSNGSAVLTFVSPYLRLRRGILLLFAGDDPVKPGHDSIIDHNLLRSSNTPMLV